jgi:hypothetical protein
VKLTVLQRLDEDNSRANTATKEQHFLPYFSTNIRLEFPTSCSDKSHVVPTYSSQHIEYCFATDNTHVHHRQKYQAEVVPDSRCGSQEVTSTLKTEVANSRKILVPTYDKLQGIIIQTAIF